jgi:hypothetical protein
MSEVIEKVDRRVIAAELKATGNNLKKVSVPRALSNHPSVEEWAEIIGTDFRRSVEATIAAGRHLQEAKDQLDDERGEFLQLLDRIGIHETTACKLMRIAAHPVISDFSHVKKLPLAWGTLYELTTLPTDVFEAKLADGTVTPDMERKDVAALKATLEGQERQSRPRRRVTQRTLGIGRQLEFEERIAELETELEAERKNARDRESELERENIRLWSEVEALRAELEDREESQSNGAPAPAARVVEPMTDEDKQRLEREGQQRLPFEWEIGADAACSREAVA